MRSTKSWHYLIVSYKEKVKESNINWLNNSLAVLDGFISRTKAIFSSNTAFMTIILISDWIFIVAKRSRIYYQKYRYFVIKKQKISSNSKNSEIGLGDRPKEEGQQNKITDREKSIYFWLNLQQVYCFVFISHPLWWKNYS